LNIDLKINNFYRTVKLVVWGGGRVTEGNEGEGIWLMDFIYLYKIEQ
jgi:hypothetical protein